jgi:hypothetical protein
VTAKNLVLRATTELFGHRQSVQVELIGLGS